MTVEALANKKYSCHEGWLVWEEEPHYINFVQTLNPNDTKPYGLQIHALTPYGSVNISLLNIFAIVKV